MNAAPARRTVVYNTVIPVTEQPPENPYIGQMWVNPETHILMTWDGSAWTDLGVSPGDFNVLSGIVTEHDNKILQNSEAIQLCATKTEVNALNALVGLKSTVYYLAAAPTEGMATGDLWIDTDDGNKLYRYSGTAWVAVDDARLQQALAAAGTAQATADGKIRTFSQPSAPTGMKASDVGDLWIDTDDKNKLYRWSGTGWVNVQDTHLDGTVSTLSASITTMAGQITAKAEKSTVDALGNRMTTAEANITAVPGAIKAAVTELDLGGTNLLLNSDMPENTASWFGSNSSTIARNTTPITGAPFPGKTAASLRNVCASGQTSANNAQDVKLIPGQKYTASAWFYIPTGAVGTYYIRAYNESWSNIGTGSAITTRNAWTFASFTFTAPSTTYTHVLFGCSGTVAGSVFHTYQMKLERGDKATDWSPAPQDPAQSLATGTSVTITPANGLEVTQTLSGGSQSLPTKFRANATQYGLYRTSDNKLLQGAKMLPDGRIVGVSGALTDPDVGEYNYISLEVNDYLESGATALSLNTPDYTLVYPRVTGDNPNPIGSTPAIRLIGNAFPVWDAGVGRYFTDQVSQIRGAGAFAVMAYTGILTLFGLHGVEINGNALTKIEADTTSGVIEMSAYNVNFNTTGRFRFSGGYTYFGAHLRATNTTVRVGGPDDRFNRVYVTLSESVSSDARLKKDIEDLDASLIYKLRPRQFRLIADESKLRFGLIAQEVKAVLDELGIVDADLYGDENPESLSLVYAELITPLIAAVQEQKARIDDLEARLAALEAKIG